MITTVLAPNPGPMTLGGTNTYVVGGVVIDPGPPDPAHLARIRAVVGPELIMLTHRHLDHSESVVALAAEWDVSARAVDPEWCVGGPPLTDQTRISSGAATITVISTPGHTDDSVCLLVEQPTVAPVLLSGDTILGRGTTVITYPEGDLGAYLASLDRLADLVEQVGVAQILPGHGPVITDPATKIAEYVAHRHERLAQVRAAVERGVRTADEVVDLVYADLDPAVRPAAVQSVQAQLAYLRTSGPG